MGWFNHQLEKSTLGEKKTYFWESGRLGFFREDDDIMGI